MSEDRILVEPTPRFRVDGELRPARTRQRTASAYVLEFATVVDGVSGHVESVYVCGRGTPTQVTELFIRGADETLVTRALQQHPILGSRARMRCLRDHLERVETFLATLGHEASLEQLDPRTELPLGC